MVICLERGADLQLMPLPLTVSCFSKIQIGFTFLVPAHPGSPGHRAVKRVCVCAVKTVVMVEKVCCQRMTWHDNARLHTAHLTLGNKGSYGIRSTDCFKKNFSIKIFII